MGGKKMVQSLDKHDNNVGLILGGIGLSLLGVLSFAANRLVHVLKGRKDAYMSRHGYPSRSLVCAPTGNGAAPARTKRAEVCSPRDAKEEVPFVSPVKRSFTVTASVVVGGRIVQPPIDEDDVVYFDD
jgi:hypothetical protein